MSTPPPTFENYPTAPDAGRPSAADEPSAAGSSTPPPAAVVAPPPPPRPDRRNVLYLLGGGAAALLAIPVLASVQDRSRTGLPEDGESQQADPSDDPDDELANEEELGDYTVGWPDGWSVDGRTDVQLVLVGGGATVVFRAYIAGTDATAVEEAQRLLNRHTTGLGKRRTGAMSRGSGSVETASIEATGVRGDGVRVDTTVHVVIASEDDRDALAVIASLPSGTSAARHKEIARMRADFLEQLA